MIEAILAIQHDVQQQLDTRRRHATRGQHPKQHGCVRAEWRVNAHLPDEWRHGLFAEPRAYPALVRFSNARQWHDDLPDAHGMAIKLFDVPGVSLQTAESGFITQDIVLVDHPVFFARDVADLVPLMIDFRRLMTGGWTARAVTLLKGLLSPDYRFRILRQMLRKLPDSPLHSDYWTMTPLRWGAGAMKLMLRPRRPRTRVQPRSGTAGRDKLGHALAAHLAQADAWFDILVQRQTDSSAMPIEDASVAWDETASPFRVVGNLRIPRQEFRAEAQLRFGENLSFTPWHGLEAHRPLGGINRARRKVYAVLAHTRRGRNVAPLDEPTLAQVDALWPPPPPEVAPGG